MRTFVLCLIVFVATSTFAQSQPFDYQKVDKDFILQKIAKTKPGTWSLSKDSEKRHYGLMDKTFFENFGNDRVGKIGTSDAVANKDKIGFNYTAIHALIHQNKDLEKKLNNTQEQLETVEQEYRRLQETHQQMLKNLEKLEVVNDLEIMTKEMEMRITELEEKVESIDE